MFVALISAMFMLVMLDRAIRLGRITNAQMRARFQLFEIRDDLRRMERLGDVQADKWFSYMDTTLTRAASSIEGLSIWHALSYMSIGNLSEIEQAQRNVSDAMIDRQELARIHARYSKCISELLRERHALLWRLIVFTAHVVAAVDVCRAAVLSILSGSPETSTLLDYAHARR